jgi:hypothetical protein
VRDDARGGGDHDACWNVHEHMLPQPAQSAEKRSRGRLPGNDYAKVLRRMWNAVAGVRVEAAHVDATAAIALVSNGMVLAKRASRVGRQRRHRAMRARLPVDPARNIQGDFA